MRKWVLSYMHHSNKLYVLYIKLRSRKQSWCVYQNKSHKRKGIWTELIKSILFYRTQVKYKALVKLIGKNECDLESSVAKEIYISREIDG